MKLPCYPLITIDPFMSIWSKTQRLYDSDTILWCNIKKAMRGIVTVDGKRFRFMGLGNEPVIEQKSLSACALFTQYCFENEAISLTVKFWTPLFADDLIMLSTPCSFVECTYKSIDNDTHRVNVEISLDREFCYDRIAKPIRKTIKQHGAIQFAQMGNKIQRPLYKSGDGVSADWGYFCIYGEEVSADNTVENGISANAFIEDKAVFVIAYDDIKSIEYMGIKYEGYYKKRFINIGNAIEYCVENYDSLYKKASEWNNRIYNDASEISGDYADMVCSAYRQILAGHKLFENDNGDLLYFSKECHSNGCINTVDVSYPALPFFLLYNPTLVKGMMTGIFQFASTKAWKFDFAPHDIGTYPIANGQVYGQYKIFDNQLGKRTMYWHRNNAYNFKSQMPVEECGNMIIMAYSYFVFSGDDSIIKDNFDMLEKWAKYLVNAGIELENQLCTDDFAGHSEKNVNLAIKEIMGIGAFSKICDALGKENNYFSIAQKYADSLMNYTLNDGTLPFALNQNDTWSLKYNLIWDRLFSFNLFSSDLYKAESKKYFEKLDTYGVALDYRKAFTKTDWMLWAATLDESGKNTCAFSKAINKYLADTDDVACFSDWINTDKPKYEGFNHRTVQGGLWMPVLFRQHKKRQGCNL